jgi:hypothetical protein
VCSPPFGPSFGAATFAKGTAIAKKFVEDLDEIVVTVMRRSQLGKARKNIILVGVGRGFADRISDILGIWTGGGVVWEPGVDW